MRILKEDLFCADFVVMSSAATILFFSFFALSYFIKLELQLAILNVCATLALLLKAGLFPVYNYTLNRRYKNNIAFSILLFVLLPYMGVVTLSKFILEMNLSNEIYLITMYAFVLLQVLTCAINALKQKIL